MITLFLALQTVGATDPLAGVDFDLRHVPAATTGNEIVVTGRRLDQRLQPLPEVIDPILPKAETGIVGKLRGGVTIDQQSFDNGTTSNRAMVTLKLPF